ncbi:hypothetical protein LTR10_007853 [Elasticomyces elasticus]|nr:hypothetical protein LTR10_007853 [Elasticomyces elasticus]KAK4970853.1 hypothetical protein LTR42_007830 [Elasticomyces elasticus]
MASDQDCHLLRIPLEMRREIYSHTTYKRKCFVVHTSDSDNSSDEGEAAEVEDDGEEIDEDDMDIYPMAGIGGVMILNILLISRQIHDEYVEYVKPRQTFFVDLGDEDIPETLDSLLSSQDTPDDALKSVRRVHIFISWSAVLHSAADERYSKFLADHTNLKLLDQESVSWTPSIVLRDKLRDFLGLINTLVRHDAKVVIHIDVGDYPDPEDPFTWKRVRNVPAGTIGPIVTGMMHAFHMGTVCGLEHDTTLEWPAPGLLKIEGMILMPLWCSLAANSAEVVKGLHAWRQGSSDQVTLPQYEESTDRVAVKLLLDVGEHSSRGGYQALISAPWAYREDEERIWAS